MSNIIGITINSDGMGPKTTNQLDNMYLCLLRPNAIKKMNTYSKTKQTMNTLVCPATLKYRDKGHSPCLAPKGSVYT